VGTEGYTATIDLPSAVALPVRSALRDLVVADRGPQPAHTIRVTTEGGGHVVTADGLRWNPGDDQSLCDQLIYVLMRASLDAAPGRLHLHGGYVALDGHGVLVGGYPTSGKSTLVTLLVASGFDYFTDERIALDRDLGLFALEKPISLTAGSFARFSHLAPAVTGSGVASSRLWHVPASAVRTEAVGEHATATAIVFLHREDGATFEMSAVHPVEMARLLLSDSPDAVRFGADAVDVAVGFCASVHCRRIVCRDVAEAVEPIRALAALDPPPSRPEIRAIAAPASAPDEVSRQEEVGSGSRVELASGVSGVLVDGRALLRTASGEIVELPEAISAWLELLDGDQTVGELVTEIASENEMSEAAVMQIARSALEQLRDRSLVR
jgi:hypothetical protein